MQTQPQRMSQNATKTPICETIDLEHVILITLRECHRMVRLSDPIANMLWTVPNCCGRARNAGQARLQPRDLNNENPSPGEKQNSCAVLLLLSASRCDTRKSLVSPEFKLLSRPSKVDTCRSIKSRTCRTFGGGCIGMFPHAASAATTR